MTAVQWEQYLDPGALALVGIGCLFIAAIQNGLSGLAQGLASAGRLLGTARESERARLSALMVEDLVRRRGVSCADRGRGTCAFTGLLGRMMSDEPGYERYDAAVARLLQGRAARRARAIRVWDDIADAAPALGMLGTVLGLVQLFAGMDSMEGLGAAMALCLLTSLYGLVFAHLIAGPIARRLQMLGESEAAWQHDIAQRMLALARREYPDRARRIEKAAERGPITEPNPELAGILGQ